MSASDLPRMSFSRQLKLVWGNIEFKNKIILFTRLRANQTILFCYCSLKRFPGERAW